jgi:hypothetical protein
LQHGQGESGRFSGAGLGGCKQIASGKYEGNGLRLDRRGLGVTLLGDSTEQLGREAEIRKRTADENLLRSA